MQTHGSEEASYRQRKRGDRREDDGSSRKNKPVQVDVQRGIVGTGKEPDKWTWELETSGDFSVRSIRMYLDVARLTVAAHSTRWNRLPSRSQLVLRGVDVESVLYLLCQEEEEPVLHLLFGCSMARQVWQRVARWIQIDIPVFDSSVDMVDWVDSQPIARFVRSKVDSICMVVIWVLWTYRNATLFNPEKAKKNLLFDNIRDDSFNCFVVRNSKVRISWVDWLQYPI
ncbi:hypothetical protein LXL04_023612 [Taraxacum kok-saghyz]